MCRSYQNCASRRDWHGRGTQAAQRGLAQLIRVFPSGVLSSTGRCVMGRWGRAPLVACMSSLHLSRRSQACRSFSPSGRDSHGCPPPVGPFLRPSAATRHHGNTSSSRHRTPAPRRHADTPSVTRSGPGLRTALLHRRSTRIIFTLSNRLSPRADARTSAILDGWWLPGVDRLACTGQAPLRWSPLYPHEASVMTWRGRDSRSS